MKRNASGSGTRGLADELAALHNLNVRALKERWHRLYGPEPPVRISAALLFQAVAYRLQEQVLGGIKSSTRRLLERVVEDSSGRRQAAPAPAIKARSGTVLIREWHGVSHRVTVLADGALFRGTRLPLVVGSGAPYHRDALVGTALLRAESASKGERSWTTLNP